MTLANALILRVRSNINEPPTVADPQRSDSEILAWLNDAQFDYISKLPADAIPDLITVATQSGSSWTIPSDFLKLLNVLVNHTISYTSGSTATEIVPAFILQTDESYLVEHYPVYIGAYAQFQNNKIVVGPSPISSTFTYLKAPTLLSALTTTFSLKSQHEEPVVLKATVLALQKLNDADSALYQKLYDDRIQAERARYGQRLDMERQK